MIIVIEGGDQAGKLTQSILLEKSLKKQKIKTKLFHFPNYDTPIGKEIRKYLDGKRKFAPQVIHCLLAANRWEKLNEILVAKEKNSVLIMNRYYHSNLVYGMANGLDKKWLQNLDAELPRTDLVILLDISQNESFTRKKSKRDRFEKNKEFSKKISQIYRKMAKTYRWKIVDASGTKDDVHKKILEIIFQKIGILK